MAVDESEPMTLEQFRAIGRKMIAEARDRFREDAFALCYNDDERAKVEGIAPAVGEVSPEEALLAFVGWLNETRSAH